MNDHTRIRTLIVSEQLMVRRGLEVIVQLVDDFVVVGEAIDTQQAAELIEKLQPDVVLMDFAGSDQASVAAIARLREQFPEIRIIVLSANIETSLITAVINAGANSWVLKNITVASLSTAIRSTMKGQNVLAPEVTAKLISTTTRARPAEVSLTGREKVVLRLMGQGLTNQEIAAELVISHATVKYHVTNILSKLGATHRSQAIVIAMQQGLLEMKKP